MCILIVSNAFVHKSCNEYILSHSFLAVYFNLCSSSTDTVRLGIVISPTSHIPQPIEMLRKGEEKTDYVFVRSRRTKMIDIRRANELSPRRGTNPKTHDSSLHFVGSNREQICRCSNPRRHGEKVFSVASESIHLNASLSLYMTRHGMESCTATEFQKYSQRREAQWAKEGVLVNDFHYGSQEKDLVCRCTQPDGHGYGPPRNPEIIEQCAEFFCLHKNRTRVSKMQWKRVNGDTPPPYGSGARSDSEYSQESNMGTFRNSDSEPPATSKSKREMKMRSKVALLTPQFRVSHRDCAAMQQEPEMPSQVWQNCRPSLWARQDGVSSTVSTPLGSSFSPFSGPSRVPATAPLLNHPSVSTSWSKVLRDAGMDDRDMRSKRTGLKTAPLGKLPQIDSGGKKANMHVAHRPSIEDAYQLQPVAYNSFAEKEVDKEAAGQHLASNVSATELSACASVAELPGDLRPQQHIPTLERLEGRKLNAISEMEAEAKKTMDQIETMSNRMSCLKHSSDLFNSLLEQIQHPTRSSLTGRARRLNSATMPSPRASEPNRDYEECVERPQGAKAAPVHKEGLADRINALRGVIFGSQVTPLQKTLRVEFPQRSEAIVCISEEDVSVAQLLLLNDHVDTHAVEAFHLWETKGIEPDWHADVIQPAVRLFQGWNRSFRDLLSYLHQAFLNLIAWAELLRLMKDSHAGLGSSQDASKMLPWIEQLQDEFVEAKEFYEKAKETWRMGLHKALSCDKVASYVAERAIETGGSQVGAAYSIDL